MKYTWDNFWAFMVGAGVVYTFWLILDLIDGAGFRAWFFFSYWDVMFLVILLMNFWRK